VIVSGIDESSLHSLVGHMQGRTKMIAKHQRRFLGPAREAG
jgi:hypothetical protein